MISSKSLWISYKLSAFKLYIFLIKQQISHIVDIRDRELLNSEQLFDVCSEFESSRFFISTMCEFCCLIKNEKSSTLIKIIDTYQNHRHSSELLIFIKIIDFHHGHRFSSRSSIFITIIDSYHHHRLSSQSSTLITIIDFHHGHRLSSQSSTLITIIDFHHDHRFSSRSSILITIINSYHDHQFSHFDVFSNSEQTSFIILIKHKKSRISWKFSKADLSISIDSSTLSKFIDFINIIDSITSIERLELSKCTWNYLLLCFVIIFDNFSDYHRVSCWMKTLFFCSTHD